MSASNISNLTGDPDSSSGTCSPRQKKRFFITPILIPPVPEKRGRGKERSAETSSGNEENRAKMWCVSCDKEISLGTKMCCGPDDETTVCTSCYKLYREYEVPLYHDAGTKQTAGSDSSGSAGPRRMSKLSWKERVKEFGEKRVR